MSTASLSTRQWLLSQQTTSSRCLLLMLLLECYYDEKEQQHPSHCNDKNHRHKEKITKLLVPSLDQTGTTTTVILKVFYYFISIIQHYINLYNENNEQFIAIIKKTTETSKDFCQNYYHLCSFLYSVLGLEKCLLLLLPSIIFFDDNDHNEENHKNYYNNEIIIFKEDMISSINEILTSLLAC